MSGPKIDQAELERQRREALERARLERIRKIREATEAVNRTLDEIKAEIERVRDDYRAQIAKVSDEIEMQDTLTRIKAAKNKLTKALTQLLDISVPTEPEDILLLNSKISEALMKAESKYCSETKEDYERIDTFMSNLQQQQAMNSFSKSLNEGTEVLEFIDFDFEKALLKQKEDVSDDLRIAAEQALDELATILNSEFSSFTTKLTASDYAKRITMAARENPTELRKVVNEVSLAKIRIQREVTDMEDLYQEYVAEYVVFLAELNESRKEKLDIIPKSRRELPTLKALQDELSTLKKLSRQVNEHNYIKQQIDEVMELFGYQMCEDIVLSPEQTGNHYLCESKNGKTAIHIHVSESKQIMMEIVGTERSNSQEINGVSAKLEKINSRENAMEAEALLAEQGRFCSIHPQITEELRKRGVILSEKSHKLPSFEYCKKIINFEANKAQNKALGKTATVVNTNRKARKNTLKQLEME